MTLQSHPAWSPRRIRRVATATMVSVAALSFAAHGHAEALLIDPVAGEASGAFDTSPAPPASASATPEASTPRPTTSEDPLEGTNRKLFAVHESLDTHIFRPAALGYRRITPRPIRHRLHDFFVNISEPSVLVNDVLQFRFKAAAVTAFRFVANSTVGVFGFFDAAATANAPHHDNGFGTTLGRYGVKAGPYIFVPLVGPSTVRDLFGSVVDAFSDPMNSLSYPERGTIAPAKTVVSGLDTRERVDEDLKQLFSTATDPYATLRSVYLQNRAADVNGAAGKTDLPDFDDPGPPAVGAPKP